MHSMYCGRREAQPKGIAFTYDFCFLAADFSLSSPHFLSDFQTTYKYFSDFTSLYQRLSLIMSTNPNLNRNVLCPEKALSLLHDPFRIEDASIFRNPPSITSRSLTPRVDYCNRII